MRLLLINGLWLFFLAGVVPLIITSVVSLFVSAIQAATHVQEQTSQFVIKLVVLFIVLLAGSATLWRKFEQLTVNAIELGASIGRTEL
jgi:type III secretory pathway component EscS